MKPSRDLGIWNLTPPETLGGVTREEFVRETPDD